MPAADASALSDQVTGRSCASAPRRVAGRASGGNRRGGNRRGGDRNRSA